MGVFMMNYKEERNEKIIRKVKRLLALSENNPNEEEAQSAFLMAQKLMFEHDISLTEVDIDEKRNIEEGQVTVFKKLFWWERFLANVISKNFKVKSYISSRKEPGSHVKRSIHFMGYGSDVKLATEMYLLAYEALLHYTDKYIENYYSEHPINRTRSNTLAIKYSYMNGFIEGLEDKYEEQIEKMKTTGNALMVLVPKEVEEKFEKTVTGKSSFTIPPIEEVSAYQKGYEQGNRIDYTRTTIDYQDTF